MDITQLLQTADRLLAKGAYDEALAELEKVIAIDAGTLPAAGAASRGEAVAPACQPAPQKDRVACLGELQGAVSPDHQPFAGAPGKGFIGELAGRF